MHAGRIYRSTDAAHVIWAVASGTSGIFEATDVALSSSGQTMAACVSYSASWGSNRTVKVIGSEGPIAEKIDVGGAMAATNVTQQPGGWLKRIRLSSDGTRIAVATVR